MLLENNGVKRIGIAVVVYRGQALVGVRPEGTVLAGAAEFPGGKCLPNETAAACAVRECLEETGLAVDVVELLDQREWTYPHGRVNLTFYLCHPVSEEDAEALSSSRSFCWTPIPHLFCYFFPEPNQPVIDKLIDRFSHSGTDRSFA